MPTIGNSATLPSKASTAHLAPATVCTCDSICKCFNGIPKGAELISLFQTGIARNEAEILELGTAKRNRRSVAALNARIRHERLFIMHEEFRMAVRAEFAN